MRVLDVRNSNVLDSPLMEDLFQRAFADSRVDADAARKWLWQRLPGGNIGLMVARGDDGQLHGLEVLAAYDSATWGVPATVMHIYSDGTPHVFAQLSRASADWCRARGFDRMSSVNTTGASTRAIRRMLKTVDLDCHEVGTAMEYTE